MACVEKSALWSYAAGELDEMAKARMDAHLSACEACRTELEAVKATREVLSFAVPVAPKVDWRKADEKVHGAVEAQMLRAQRSWNFWTLGLAGAGAFALVLAVLAINDKRGADKPVDPNALAMVKPIEPVQPVEPLVEPSLVETADGTLVAFSGDQHLAKAGEGLKAGAQVKTTTSGKAIVKLPEGSRVRVASASDLLLSKAAKDEVGLVLKSGRVAVTATHAARKAFLVEAGGATVRVVGTAFTVGLSEGIVEVAVAEGRVLVELPDGQVKPVSAGERLSMDRSKPIELEGIKPLPLTGSDRTEIGELGVEVVVAVAPKPVRPAAPKPVVAVAPVPTPSPTPIPVPEAKPAEPAVAVAAPQTQPGEPSEAWKNRLRNRPQAPLRSKSHFETLVDMYEESSKNGACGDKLQNFVAFLDEPGEDVADMPARAKAACLVARCYSGMDEGALANSYYRKCLNWDPSGPLAAEARKNLP
ncbi:MAG: FecR domain-containing protein [Myxococcales bacterium]